MSSRPPLWLQYLLTQPNNRYTDSRLPLKFTFHGHFSNVLQLLVMVEGDCKGLKAKELKSQVVWPNYLGANFQRMKGKVQLAN